jgi:hypothetical protein
METSTRLPTKRMVEKLKECLDKQTKNNGQIPCLPDEMKSSLAGLYKRGYITTRMAFVDQKKQLCIYVTDKGKAFLESLEARSGI